MSQIIVQYESHSKIKHKHNSKDKKPKSPVGQPKPDIT